MLVGLSGLVVLVVSVPSAPTALIFTGPPGAPESVTLSHWWLMYWQHCLVNGQPGSPGFSVFSAF